MRIKENKLLIIVIFVIIVGGFIYSQNTSKVSGDLEENLVCIGEFLDRNCFDVEVVSTPQERRVGLMNREFLAENAGMLFIFESEDIYSFWMKDTLIPLDIIWINSEKEIVFIAENTEPLSLENINPGKKARYVLEINGGLSEELGIEVGDKVTF